MISSERGRATRPETIANLESVGCSKGNFGIRVNSLSVALDVTQFVLSIAADGGRLGLGVIATVRDGQPEPRPALHADHGDPQTIQAAVLHPPGPRPQADRPAVAGRPLLTPARTFSSISRTSFARGKIFSIALANKNAVKLPW